MIDWIYYFPGYFIVLLFLAIFFICFFILRWLIQRYLAVQLSEPNAGFLMTINGTMTFALSIILGFSLFQVINAVHTIKTINSEEVSHIQSLDGVLLAFKNPYFQNIREDLTVYTKSIIDDEWPNLKKGMGSERTRRLFHPIRKEIYAYEALDDREQKLYSKAVQLIDSVEVYRVKRILNSRLKLDNLFWFLIGSSLIVHTIGMSMVGNTPIRAIISAFYLALIVALASVVFLIDEPYKGGMYVDNSPFQKLLREIQTR